MKCHQLVSFFVRLCSSRIPASRRVVFFVVWEARSSTGEAKPTVSFGKSFESFAFCFFPMFWTHVDKHMIYIDIHIYNYVYMQYAVCKFSTFWPTVFWHRRECGICLNGPSRCTRTLCLGCLVNIVGICRMSRDCVFMCFPFLVYFPGDFCLIFHTLDVVLEVVIYNVSMWCIKVYWLGLNAMDAFDEALQYVPMYSLGRFFDGTRIVLAKTQFPVKT